MSDTIKDGGPAFPQFDLPIVGAAPLPIGGMTLRQWYAGQALANGEICTGDASEHYLVKWFGDRHDITREEIAAKQAFIYADAMIAAGEDGQ